MSGVTMVRARTATLVVVGTPPLLSEAAKILGREGHDGAVRVVLIATDAEQPAAIDAAADVAAIGGLRPEYVNNAIAAVRYSSLPTVVWWRGGQPEKVDGVASLADRVILDASDTWPLWRRIPALFEQTGFTDLRWTRLTRWRSSMAHFFDLPQIQALTPTFTHLTVCGRDRPQCALFAGWLSASLGWNGRVATELCQGSEPMDSVRLSAPAAELSLTLLPNHACLATEAREARAVLASSVVSLGGQDVHVLLAEELRVRSRDLAFERALEHALRLGT